jgi:membrane-associated phospholipid phosphatase
METLLQWGLDFIRQVQSAANPGLTAFMKIVTNFGAAPAYMVLLPLIFWCIDEKKGIRLGLTIMVSTWVNLSLKFLCKQPRPFWPGYDPGLGIITESLNGFPSGHAQTSLVMWEIVASWGNKRRFFIIAGLVSLLVGFSRVYLGVHFPTDLVGGWILGGIVLALYVTLADRIEAFLVKGGMRVQFIVSAAAAFVMILYNPAAAGNMEGGVQALVMPGGVIFGMGIAYSLNANLLRFRAKALFGRKGAAWFFTLAGRFILGILGVVLVFILFRIVARFMGEPLYRLSVFLQFALLEFWIYLGAPWLFQALRLAEKIPARVTPTA